MTTAREVIAREFCALDFPAEADLMRKIDPPEPALKLADGLLSALKAAGFVVVPEEPTQAMWKAGGECLWRNTEETAIAWAKHDKFCGDADWSVEVYKAMLTAATPPLPSDTPRGE